MNIGFQGEEDDILKNIEENSMPLNSSLIQGSQSLFGEVETQWGRLYNTTVFSQQKGERSEIEVEGGAQTQEYIRVDDYEANCHYFLSQYFHDQYDDAMRSLPVPNSGVILNHQPGGQPAGEHAGREKRICVHGFGRTPRLHQHQPACGQPGQQRDISRVEGSLTATTPTQTVRPTTTTTTCSSLMPTTTS